MDSLTRGSPCLSVCPTPDPRSADPNDQDVSTGHLTDHYLLYGGQGKRGRGVSVGVCVCGGGFTRDDPGSWWGGGGCSLPSPLPPPPLLPHLLEEAPKLHKEMKYEYKRTLVVCVQIHLILVLFIA